MKHVRTLIATIAAIALVAVLAVVALAAPTVGGSAQRGQYGGGGGGPAPDLAVELSGIPDPVGVGDPFTYVARVFNQSPGDSSVVRVRITLPSNVDVVSISADRGPGCTGSSTLDCNLDYIPGNGSARVVVRVKVTGPGDLVASARVTLYETDKNPADNQITLKSNVRSTASTGGGPVGGGPTGSTGGSSSVHKINGTSRNDNITGTSRPDLVNAGAGNDRVNGGKGNDTVNGGPGNDTLTGGPGLDKLNGGPGNDVIEARDGSRDTVTCGSGSDRVRADRLDRVALDCERISK